MSIQWDVPPEQAFDNLTRAYVAALRQGVRDIANLRAPQIAAWMQANHPWQNQTGAAEAGLHTEVEELADDMLAIILSHGDDVPYGIYLETKFGGRDAVITPALDVFGPVVWQDVLNMLS